MTDEIPTQPPAEPIGPKVLPVKDMRLSIDEVNRRRSPNPGPLERMFYQNPERGITKWTHYLPFYEQLMAPYRGKPVRFLEIGVFRGGSLDLWRRYFGPDAVLYGIDIDPACAERVTAPNQVRIGSQDDPDFLNAVVDEMGGIDIVLDDGSHIGRHQLASFRALWPRLEPFGRYVMEDLHTSYWPGFEGGLRKPGTGIELVKALIDDMHGWYHGHEESLAPREEIGAVTVTDSIAVIQKVPPKLPPGRVLTGDWTTPRT